MKARDLLKNEVEIKLNYEKPTEYSKFYKKKALFGVVRGKAGGII